MRTRSWLLLAAVVALAPVARGDVKAHPLFSDNMVLQRDMDIVVWGTAEPGEKVTVTLVGDGREMSGDGPADDKGVWKLNLPKQKAGTGYTLTIKGKNEVTFKNVAVGDVWLCSGQSNMEWKLNQLNKADTAKGT